MPKRHKPRSADEQAFLAAYDASQFPHPSITVDVALVTADERGLRAVLSERQEHPDRGKWSLPGGFVGMKESLDAAAARVLETKVGVRGIFLEQLYTLGDPDRDPRTRVITVAYYALVDSSKLLIESTGQQPMRWMTLRVPWEGERGGEVRVRDEADKVRPVAFDHAEILGMVVQRLRGKLDYAPIGFELLPRKFTLRQLQSIHETILGRKLNKDSFRRRMLAAGMLAPTGELEKDVGHRPAELYRFKRQGRSALEQLELLQDKEMVSIETLLDNIRALASERELVVLLLIVCLTLLLVQAALHGAAWCMRNVSRGWLIRVLDPSHFSAGSVWQERAEWLLAWLDHMAWFEHDAEAVDVVTSPSRVYHRAVWLAVGDLCHLYHAWSGDQAYLLKRARVSGVDRLLDKEQRVLSQLQQHGQGSLYGAYFPMPIESFWSPEGLVSVFAWRDGFLSASEIVRRLPGGVDGRHLAWMLNRTWEALGFAHTHGWIHGAVLPPHLLFHPGDHGLQLVGWLHAERANSPLRVVPRRFKVWYPPECHRREVATPATDMYLAAKSMTWIAGGNPLTDTMPDHLPHEIICVLRECLLESPSRRPQDAWQLHEYFKEVLEGIYGPPRFCDSGLFSSAGEKLPAK